jgi:hypothetical protein
MAGDQHPGHPHPGRRFRGGAPLPGGDCHAAERPIALLAEGAAAAGLLEKHLQLGLLYGREGARRRFTPDRDAELVAALDMLGVTSSELARTVDQLTRTVGDLAGQVEKLTGQAARLARLQPIGAVLDLWRRLRQRRRPHA